jgi:ABC-type Fe3+-hydroxamate transport system substrate-binding protein
VTHASSLPRTTTLLLLLLLLLALTGCGLLRGESQPASSADTPLPVGSTAWLVCSPTCATQAQCGTITGTNNRVVLLNREQAATATHNLALEANQAVTVTQVSSEQMVRQADTAQLSMLNFYRVRNNAQQEGWVAGWCLATQPQN